MNDNFTAASSSALAVGQKIMAMGATNPDGSLAANIIIIGNSGTDFSSSSFMMFRNRNASGTPPMSGNQAGEGNQPGQPGPGGQMPDRSRFQNMSEEERRQFTERMRANGGGSSVTGNRQFRANGSGPVIGEIIELSLGLLTVKLDGGGSKLVFYSGQTAINMTKETENP